MINSTVFKPIFPKITYTITTNMATQTEAVITTIENYQLCNFFGKDSQFYEDRKLHLILLKAKNANIFRKVENDIKMLSETLDISREKFSAIIQNLNQLISIVATHSCDQNDYIKALLLQRMLIEKITLFLEAKRKANGIV